MCSRMCGEVCEGLLRVCEKVCEGVSKIGGMVFQGTFEDALEGERGCV